MRRMWMLLALAVLAPAGAETDPAAQKVLECMRANVPAAVRIRAIELTSTDRSGGSRTLKGRLFATREKSEKSDGLVRAMLKIEAPADLAGAAYLVRERDDFLSDGMYVYLPSVRRVRRVTGSFADGALLGTNFSYNDFRQMENAFGDLSAKIEAPQEIEKRATHVLSFKAVPNQATKADPGEVSVYSSVRTWVDQKTCVPLKAEFYQGTTARKQLTVPLNALQQSGDYWYAAEVRMQDLKDGSSTVLRIVNVTASDKLPKGMFDPNSFYLSN